MRFSTKQEGWFAVSAAFVALVLMRWDERAAFAVAIIALVILAWHEFAKRSNRQTADATQSRSEDRTQNITSVLNLFNGRMEITNNDVEELLGVSDSTATNYLQELEDAGKIRQIGTVGRHVRYRRVNG